MNMIDNEDTEVEMLSISSGDEDSEKDPRGGVGRKGRGRESKEDDGAWDGGEPDRWKRVDEVELARRVREMRESKTVPVPQKNDRKTIAAAGRVLSSLQSFSRGMECIDPLGLGIIDNKTLRLITATSDPSKFDRDHINTNLREKLVYFSEKFDAKLFLSRIHQDTTIADLEAGVLALKDDLQGHMKQKKQLVKDHFDCFVSCKTTIDDIQSKLKRIDEDPEGSGANRLFNCIEGVSSLGNRALEPLFERQAQAEKIRSVQGILQRFRTLFNLPSTIRASISKGEYDFAVREYKKAKSIALPSQVSILKQVHEEAEKVMQEFKGMLYKSMDDLQIDLTSLEKTVRLLLELEPESDPVWHFLNVQNQRIQGLLEKCTSDHEDQMETLRNETRVRAVSDAKWQQIQQNLSQSSNPNYSFGNIQLPVDLQPVDLTGEEVDILRCRYIRRLTAVIVHHIPPFWKVALSVFSGKFAKSSQVSDSSASKTEEKVGEARYSSHTLDEVSGMLRDTISLYEFKVLNAFRDLEESNVLHSYISDAIKEISKACLTCEAKDSSLPIVAMALRMLQAEVTKIHILRLCSWMRANTDRITDDETWILVSILERNQSPYTISFLPLAFRSFIASAMDQINIMVQSLRSEATKFADMIGLILEIQESVRLAFLNCFLNFAGNLEQIGNELVQNNSSNECLHLQNVYSREPVEELTSDLPGSVVDPHLQLLIVLSNTGYCKDELSSELYNKYKGIWLQSGTEREEEESDKHDLLMSFTGLEEKALEQYTFAKANLIRTAAMNYLLDCRIQWGSAPAVKGVRDAAFELLHTLVAVHAEVFAGAKPLLKKTLGILVEGLIDTFISLFNENGSKDLSSLDANGFCQLMLELEYFETILNPYFTAEARESMKSLQGMLLEKATEFISKVAEHPGHQRRSTRGIEDAAADEKQQGVSVSPDDLIALAKQYSSELLQAELARTRINMSCFVAESGAESGNKGANVSSSKNVKGTRGVRGR